MLLCWSVVMYVAKVVGIAYCLSSLMSRMNLEFKPKTIISSFEESKKWASKMLSATVISLTIWKVLKLMIWTGFIWSVYMIAKEESWLNVIFDVTSVATAFGGPQVAIIDRFVVEMIFNWTSIVQQRTREKSGVTACLFTPSIDTVLWTAPKKSKMSTFVRIGSEAASDITINI